jgi:hypothetical protein
MIGFVDNLFTHYSGLQVIQHYLRFTHFTVHRSTRPRFLSLHLSYPDNGFIILSLSLQITHKVFFAPPNSFLAISSQSPSTAIPRTRQQLTQINSSSTELSQLLTTNFSLETPRYIALGRTPQKTPSSIVPYCFSHVY